MRLSAWTRVAWPVYPGAFRLFLALLVFAHHCSSLGLGKYAVYVFFALSGFWVQRMWVGRYGATDDPYLTFVVSRVWRLLPVFLLANLVTVPLLLLIGHTPEMVFESDPAHLLASPIFLRGYTRLPYMPVAPAWSLYIETQYYVIAPLLALAVTRTRVAPLLAAAALVSLVAGLGAGPPVLPDYLFFFCSGLAAAHARWRPSGRTAAWSAGAVAAAVALIALGPWRGMLFGGAHPGPLFGWNPPLNVALAVLTIPFALYTTRQPSDAADRTMADLSYIVYLLHWGATQWLATVSGPWTLRLACTALAWAVVLPLSWLVWRFVDRPINEARARWVAARVHLRRHAIAHGLPGR